MGKGFGYKTIEANTLIQKLVYPFVKKENVQGGGNISTNKGDILFG